MLKFHKSTMRYGCFSVCFRTYTFILLTEFNFRLDKGYIYYHRRLLDAINKQAVYVITA